jgi:hypothetical protein
MTGLATVVATGPTVVGDATVVAGCEVVDVDVDVAFEPQPAITPTAITPARRRGRPGQRPGERKR